MTSQKQSVVEIYINKNSENAKILLDFFAKYISDINRSVILKIISVNKNNISDVKARGITRVPTLLYGNRKYESVNTIIKILTPPNRAVDSPGYGVTTSDELMHNYQKSLLDSGEEMDTDGMKDTEMRDKMASFEKRRASALGTSKTKPAKKTKGVVSKEFNNDEDFIKFSGTRDIKATPTENFKDEKEGDLLLEEYYLDEAIKGGKKVSKTIKTKRR